jgi:hypothetical protein
MHIHIMRGEINFTISETCETIRQDNISELSAIRLHLSMFGTKAYTCNCTALPPGDFAVKKMATPLQKAKNVVWFKETKCVKRVQRRYRMESGVDPPFK